jgi:hypothetical protein
MNKRALNPLMKGSGISARHRANRVAVMPSCICDTLTFYTFEQPCLFLSSEFVRERQIKEINEKTDESDAQSMVCGKKEKIRGKRNRVMVVGWRKRQCMRLCMAFHVTLD